MHTPKTPEDLGQSIRAHGERWGLMQPGLPLTQGRWCECGCGCGCECGCECGGRLVGAASWRWGSPIPHDESLNVCSGVFLGQSAEQIVDFLPG